MSSVLDNISSVNLLESLITNDARWSWILDEWKASNDATQRDLAKRVDRFRENFVSETAGLIAKLLGDIEGPDDVKKYKQRAADVGVQTDMEPEPSPDGSIASDDDFEVTGDSSD